VFPRIEDPLGVMHAKEKSAKYAQGWQGGNTADGKQEVYILVFFHPDGRLIEIFFISFKQWKTDGLLSLFPITKKPQTKLANRFTFTL